MPQPSTPSQEPNIRLPMAVRRQIERVNAMSNPDPDTPPAGDAVNADPNPAPATPQPAPIEPPITTAPEQPGEPIIKAPAGKENDPIYWRNRFSAVHGMLESLRRQRLDEKRDTDARIAQLQQQLAEVQRAQPAAPQAVDLTEFFSPAEIEQYGEDQLTTVARAAVAAATKQLRGVVEQEVAPLRERQEREARATEEQAQQDFLLALAGLVPDYQEVDAGDDWKGWLTQRDPVSRIQRQMLLNARVQERDAEGVAELFNAFKSTLNPRATPPVAPAAQAGTVDGVPQPTAALGAPTDAEIRAHYKDRKLGKLTKKQMDEFDARLARFKSAA